MGLVRSLFARITTRVDAAGLKRYNTNIGRTKKEMTFAAREAKRARRQFNQLAFAAKAAAGAWVGSTLVRTFTTDFAKQADAAAKYSKSLGVSTKFYTGLQHGIEGLGIDGEETSQIIADVAERMFDASEGSKALADDFKLIGLEKKQLKELAKAGPEAQIMALADAIQRAGASSKRTFVAMSGLGDVGKRLLPLLEQGSAGLRAQFKEAEKLGVVYDETAAKMGQDFNRELFKARQLAKGVRNQIAMRLLPSLIKLLKRFGQWAKEGNNVERALTRMKIAAAALIPVLAIVASAKVVAAFVAVKGAIIAAVAALKAMGTAALFAQAKLMLIPAALALMVLLLEDIWVFAQGGDSLVGKLFGDSKEAQIFLDVLREIGKLMGEIGAELAPVFQELGQLLEKPFRELWKLIRPLGPFIGKSLRWALIGVAAVIWLILKVVIWVIKGIKAIAKWTAGDATSAVKNGLLAAWEFLGKVVTGIWDGIKAAGAGAAWAVGKAWDGIVWFLKTILDGIKWLWDQIAGAGKAAGEAIGFLWRAQLAAIGVIIAGLRAAWEGIKAAGSWAADAARSAWSTATGAIRKGLDTLSSWEKTKSAATAAASWVKTKFLEAAKAIRGAFASVASKIADTLKSAGGKIKSAARAGATLASDLVSGSQSVVAGLAPLPALAPERAAAGGAGGAGPTNVTIQAPIRVDGSVNMDSEEAAAKLQAAASRALQSAVAENFADRKPLVKPKPTASQ